MADSGGEEGKTMQLIDKKATLEFFAAPGAEELETWCRENGFTGVHPTQDAERAFTGAKVPSESPSDHVLAAALYHATAKYPEADNIDVCSFGGLVAYLATGWYGGFGTESYDKEQQATNIVLALAGGLAPEPGDMFGLIPERALTTQPSAEFTNRVLDFLEGFYFGDPEGAVAELLESVDEKTAARVVLSLAKTQAEYKRLVEVANGFLKKKESISTLRQAVRAVLGGVAGAGAQKDETD